MRSAHILTALCLAPLAGCATATQIVSLPGATASVETAETGVAGPFGSVGAGVASFAVAIDPADQRAQPYIGPWTLVRSGDRVCEVDLGSRTAAGRFAAKTRRCMSVDLARIATWQPLADGVVLYDFEDRPVVTLVRNPGGVYEGPLADGTRLTLWR